MAHPVQYSLNLAGNEIILNGLIDHTLVIRYLNQINCIKCGRITSKSFAQGYCFPCFRSAPETEECVLRPELCRAHEGIARDIKFSKAHCLIDHYVYLSYTSGFKVGVTRNTQIPVRWIDQGAIMAVKIAKTPNRYLAGCIEVAMKEHFNDKTQWRLMLKDISKNIDINPERERALDLMPEEFISYRITSGEPVRFDYPVVQYPENIRSISLDKNPLLSDKLVGIKGQYLIFESGLVFNVRSHSGYLIELQIP